MDCLLARKKNKLAVFNKKELAGIILILLFIFGFSAYNFALSLRRARDVQRRNDLTALADALEVYFNDFDRYPISSSDSKIVACLPQGWTFEDMKKILGGQPVQNRAKMFAQMAPCEWGASSLADVSDNSRPIYLTVIPQDPRALQGASYRYLSTGQHFQLLASFEGKDNPEYSQKILARKILCGTKICNFGKASHGTPLDVLLEEYEKGLKK